MGSYYSKNMKSYDSIQHDEAITWCIKNQNLRDEKIMREWIRYPKLIKDLLLDRIDTQNMEILDVGGGPISLITLLSAKKRIVLDPLTEEYKKYFPCPYHIKAFGENIPFENNSFDLVVTTNALDHTENPSKTVEEMNRVLRSGGYFAVMCTENNALTHPHPAHVHNLTSDFIHDLLDDKYETVWELNYKKDKYRYGWVPFQGKVGQPAFAVLFRKTIGY